MKRNTKTWKEFEQNPLTHSAAHYLIAIHELTQNPGYARLTDIAKKLDITPGSCSISLRALKRKGFIDEDENKFMRLSKEGARLVEIVEKNDTLLQVLFTKVLGVAPKKAEIDACKMEHLLSMETSFKLAAFINFIESDNPKAQEFLKEAQKHRTACWKEVGEKSENDK